MKKTIFLSAFMLMAFGSQAWAACANEGTTDGCCLYENNPENCYGINGANDKDGDVLQTSATCLASSGRVVTNCTDVIEMHYCLWNVTGNCQILQENDYANCKSNGWHFTSTSSGLVGNTFCDGATLVPDQSKNSTPPLKTDPIPEKLGCCKWDGATCAEIYTEKEKTDCKNNNAHTFSETCDNSGICPLGSSNPSSSSGANASSSSGVAGVNDRYCIYLAEQICTSGHPANYTCPNGGMISASCPDFVIQTPSSSSGAAANNSSSSSQPDFSGFIGDWYCVYPEYKICTSGHPSDFECPGTILPKSTTCPDEYVGGTPIIVLSHSVPSNKLSAMQNAVNFQATGNASIHVYDLKGNTVRSFKFTQGNYIVPLSDLPRGLYIVRASNASWKQTIKATVK